MPTRLGPLIGPDQLPAAELCALRLDGELYCVDELLSPLDQPESPALRAEAFAALAPAGAIAEGPSAAWIYGLVWSPPARHTALQRPGALGHPRTGTRLRVREASVDNDEVVRVGCARVLAPVRMLSDLARLSERWGEEERALAVKIAAFAGFRSAHWRACLAAPHLPFKLRALQRLADLERQGDS